MNRKKRAVKRNHIIELVAGLLIIISLNVISKYIFERFDMTAERRYSLSQATKDMLTNLDDVAFVRVYLEGDFPPDFKRLRNETREMLDEFRSWSKNIEYEFVNPLEGADKTAQQGIIQQLYDKGIRASVLTVDEDEGSSEKVIVPAAMVYYKGRETPIQLLKDQYGIPPEEVLNNSVQSLEYEISNAIRKLSIPIKQKIGFLEGHGELESILMADIMNALSEYYLVDRVAINEKLKALNEYQALVIAKPDSAFTEKDKFIIDQFVMRGGKVLWFIDPVWASMDSLQYNGHTIGFANRINLEDQLFKYGVRLNTTLAQDLMALPIPVVVGNIGSQKQISSKPWYFFPLLIPASGHPIVKNLNMVKTEFASTIDTIAVPGVKKTFLLTTDRNSKISNTPIRISLDALHYNPDEKQYRKAYQPIAVLLEGEFTSNYRNRIPPTIAEDPEIKFKESSMPNKMIVVADGDIIKNQLYVNISGDTSYYDLGFDKYTSKTFGNKNFVLNAVNYLCDDSNLISVRSREVKLRLLNIQKIKQQRLFWQVLNIGFPLLLIIVAGILYFLIKKRKYRK